MVEEGAELGVSTRASFSKIRYAQCWEDADVLLEALDIRPGDTCLSIASAGDNSLALLTRDPARVIAVDVSAPQIACLELRVAAYRALDHPELLELLGSRPSSRRPDLYRRCRSQLSPEARTFWDENPEAIASGIGAAGKFERYLALFRRRILPWVHGRSRVERLLQGGTCEEREQFYDEQWNTMAWRLMFRLFFSRPMLGRVGRDPEFFRYVRGDVPGAILERTRYALTRLNPAENPYVQWILTGQHGTALPQALRPENFEVIRGRLDRLEWHCLSLERFLDSQPEHSIARFNMSDIFEYVSASDYEDLLLKVLRVASPRGRLVYWNLLVDRRRPQALADRLQPLEPLAHELHRRDKAFFYDAMVIEEVLGRSGAGESRPPAPAGAGG